MHIVKACAVITIWKPARKPRLKEVTDKKLQEISSTKMQQWMNKCGNFIFLLRKHGNGL